MRVQALISGEYGGQFYEAGDVFDLVSPSDFSDSTINYGANSGTQQFGWMTVVADSTPLYQARTSGIYATGPYFGTPDARRTVY